MKFEFPLFNYLLFTITSIFPLISLLLIFNNPKNSVRLIGRFIYSASLLIFIPIFLFSIIDLSFSFSDLISGKDYSFEKIATYDFPNCKMSVYRTNGGATTSYGIVLRKEIILLPGIIHINQLYSRYKACNAIITKVDSYKVKCIIPKYNNVKADTLYLSLE